MRSVPTPSTASQAVTVFDLIARPEGITPPWFLGIFWALCVAMVLLALLARRQRWRERSRVNAAVVALVLVCVTVSGTWDEINWMQKARAAVRDGSFRTVEGCLSAFHPGEKASSRTTSGNEVWTVGGVLFSYGTGEEGFTWHRVEALGGAVHADSRVNVAYLRKYGSNEILRLAVSAHACPRAPDPGSR